MFQVPRNKTMSRLGKVAVAALSVAALTLGVAGAANAAVLNTLPGGEKYREEVELKYMPYFDYDSNSCFPVAAVDASGRLNGGLNNSGSVTGGCRTGHLGRANTYTRMWCKNGWCAFIYALYFEKDQAGPGTDAVGHRHDWESVVVFVKQGEERPRYLAASRHGQYSTHRINEVPMDGNHVKIVYHKDGTITHTFRFAKWGEDTEAWGRGNKWDTPTLVDILKMEPTPRNALWSSRWGKANLPLGASFADNLNKARPAEVPAW